jgi:hypothetical protein
MSSIITAEEYYSESIGFLFSIEQTQEEILDVLQDISSLSFSGGAKEGEPKENKDSISSLSDGLNIDELVRSVNSIDKDKAVVLTDLVNTLKIDSPDVSESTTKNMSHLTDMANSAIGIAKNLSSINPIIGVANSASTGLTNLLTNLANGFARVGEKHEEVELSEKTLKHIGLGILVFAGSIAGASLLIGSSFDIKTLATVGLAIGIFSLEFQMIGKHGDLISDGAKSVGFMALAIPAFALGIAFAMPIMNPESLLGIGLVIAGFALEFGIIGKFATNIEQGALAVGVMALAIPIFALGVTIASAIMDIGGIEGLVMVAGAIAVFGLEFAIIGSMWSEIGLGALVVGAMGLSLMLLASPLEKMSHIFGTDKSKSMLWELPVLLTAIGSVYALAGVGSELILLGALSFGAVGLSLYAVGKGVDTIMSIKNLSVETADIFSDVLTSILGSINNISLADALLLPVKASLIGLAGSSLSSIGIGIQTFKKNTDGFDEGDADRMSYVISKVSQAFATAGSTEGMSSLFGFNVGSNDVERGIDSTLKMGKNLDQLAKGIGAWRDGKFTKQDVKLVAENVNNVMNVIPSVFASIGLRERQSSNQISVGGFKFSMPFTKTDTELGISTTMKLGENLTNLYQGVASWAKGGKNDITPKIGGIIENITSILTTIPKIFAEVGKQAQEGSSLMGLIDGDMEDGVELVERMSSPLKAITSFLDSFNNQKVDVKKASREISDMISNLGSGINILNPKKVNVFEDLVDVFEDFNDVIKDYFKTISKMPMKEFEAFDKHIHNLVVASTLKPKSVDMAFDSTIEVYKPAVPNIKETSSVIAHKNTPPPVDRVNKKAVENNEKVATSNQALNATLQSLIDIMSQNMKANNDILNYIKSGTFKTSNSPF